MSKFIENKIPAGYSFGANHDGLVGAATGIGLPDWLVNIPSMPFVYIYSVGAELINTPAYISNRLFNTSFTPPDQYNYPLRQGVTP